MKTLVRVMVAACLLVPVVATALFFGFRANLATIETPSMGTYAPVGTLIVTLPVERDALRVGDTILFTPPGETRTYFHRVERFEGTQIITHGDLNAAVDPWTVTMAQVHGRDVLRVPYAGWLVKYLPFLLLGGIALLVYVRLFVRTYKLPVLVFGVSLLLGVGNVLVRPFVRADMLSQTVEHGKIVAHFVVTGMLPLLARTRSGNSVIAYPGQAVTLTVGDVKTAVGDLTLTPLFLNTSLLVCVAVFALLPVLISLLGRTAWRRGAGATTVADADIPANDAKLVELIDPVQANIFAGKRLLDVDATYRERIAVPGSYRHELDDIYGRRAAVNA